MMINADRDITIFNLRYDAASRREVFIPTCISDVSYYDVRGSDGDGSNREESSTVKIRIPFTAHAQADREYVSEEDYSVLSDEEAAKHWTLQKGCYIAQGTVSFGYSVTVTAEQLREYSGVLVTVTEYADNTRRGSRASWHWRIGGKL